MKGGAVNPGEKDSFKSGFVSIIGKPNVGKSTLLNHLLNRKIAPVSKKPETTRLRLHGIRTDRDSQIIFVDTPGIHSARDPLGRALVATAKKAFGEADLIYFLAEPMPSDEASQGILDDLKNFKGPVFLVLNKVDLLKEKQDMLPIMDWYQKRFVFKELIPISALKGTQCDVLLAKTKEYLPVGPAYFPADMVCDQPVSDIVRELIREKVMRFTGEEIPYATAVAVDEIKERSQDLVMIRATVFVEKDSQKKILIGKGGSKMKEIGRAARGELERFLFKRVYLDLWVKVLPGWKKNPDRLKRLGYQ